ncbi:DUF3800 domain-containing protein [Phycicoccus endophyticus]|uniref:DUF3800 domain-containing protein n=1 Tax=Phycicoccus endophyticus TaxID=1690220 RepID=A0A7G9R3F3_9MICO|nr:DUF3800 domain-containing protein [Phycicoccus endophyticus]NHI19884.1 DUF3800 domain-containing protein [Phycicoccus endophyticus]QNN50128.1 DUF3800 domain-containing protein [Phycicoccus endophyticus]GGL27785.1 hypothetical protein GCM10012283_07500 [Phycicoccus endophyticus]
MTLPVLRAYVDETGDRGLSPSASPFYATATILLPAEDEPELLRCVRDLRARLNVPSTKPLHWVDHVKTFPRRRTVAQALGRLDGLSVNYVLMAKASVPPQASGLRGSTKTFYNYIAGVTLDRALLAAQHWPGGRRRLEIVFGHVRGFGQHEDTMAYFEMKKSGRAETQADYGLLDDVKFDSTGTWLGLQAADQYAGILSAAILPDRVHGTYEEPHLLDIQHQVRRGPGARVLNYGFKAFVGPHTLPALPWWPPRGWR